MTAFTVRAIQFILVGALATLPAMATTITFTISQEAVSVDLNGTVATDELVTFTQTTDTTLITTPPRISAAVSLKRTFALRT